MNIFDARTTFMIIGLFYLLLPVVTWMVMAGQRTPQVILWCCGGLLVSLSSILVGFRSVVPDWFSISLPCLLFTISHFVRIQSFRLDLGMPWPTRWILGNIVIIFLIFEALHYGLQNYILRAQFNFIVGAGLLIYLSMLAWRIGCQEQSISAKWIARVYGLVVIMMLARVFYLINYTGNPDMLHEGPITILFALSMLLSAVVGHLGYVGLMLDRSRCRELVAATEHARAEESRRLGKQISHLDRQRSLGLMAASLGHELNQPLTAILTNAQVARLAVYAGRMETDQQKEFLERIIFNTKRANQIIERICNFIRPSAYRSESVDLKQIVLEVVELIAQEAHSEQVAIHFYPPKQGVQVKGDPIQLSQIVLNIFRNAIQALTGAKRREIQVSCHSKNGWVVLRIRDTGPGFQPEALKQAGMPFFTTKPDGLGMGISISLAIAVQHGGKLTLSNAEPSDGGGAIIELNLPALAEEKI